MRELYARLNAELRWSAERPPRERFVVVEDTLEADGAFLLFDVLHVAAACGARVACIGFELNLMHVAAVCRRLNIPLTPDSLLFVDASSSPLAAPARPDDVLGHGAPNLRAPLAVHARAGDVGALVDDAVRAVQALADETPAATPLYVVVDSLSALAALSGAQAARDVARLVLALRGLLAARGDAAGGMLVVRAHGDVPDDRAWLAALAHPADLTLYVDGLVSGYSRDVHGQLTILHGSSARADRAVRLNYRCADSDVQFFTTL